MKLVRSLAARVRGFLSGGRKVVKDGKGRPETAGARARRRRQADDARRGNWGPPPGLR